VRSRAHRSVSIVRGLELKRRKTEAISLYPWSSVNMNMKANMEAFLDSESGVINRKEDLKIQPQEGDEDTPASRYVQALGPLRMSFVEGFGQGQIHFACGKRVPLVPVPALCFANSSSISTACLCRHLLPFWSESKNLVLIWCVSL
jgi:hypothetical protein